MYMLQLNDLLHPSEWEPYWTFYGYEHEGLPKDVIYVIFEYYCSNTECKCKNIKIDIMQLGDNKEPIEESLAIINYDWSSVKTKCYPTLDEESPKTQLALNLLEVYKKFIHSEDYLTRIKQQYNKVKKLSYEKKLQEQKPAEINFVNKHISRNAKCPCGSNKKYKKCCLLKYNSS